METFSKVILSPSSVLKWMFLSHSGFLSCGQSLRKWAPLLSVLQSAALHTMFETGAPKYQWLHRIVAVATGERLPDEVIITVYEVT